MRTLCVTPFWRFKDGRKCRYAVRGRDERIDQTETIKRLKEENAKLKRALSDAEVENANLRTEIDVRKHREKIDKETNNRVLLVLTIAAALILLIRFTAPRLRKN